MSEFQYYEFVAIDRPLSFETQKRLRKITSRATITSTRLVNTYEWGNFKGDPHQLVAKHFDAFLYYANWGTRRLMLRVPKARIDPGVVKRHCPIRTSRNHRRSSAASFTMTGAYLVMDLWSEQDAVEDEEEDTELSVLSALVPIRNELMDGDYRALALAWRLRTQDGEIRPDSETKRLIGQTDRLTGSQQALVEFLRIRV